MKKALAILLFLIIFLTFGADLAQAQVLCESCDTEGVTANGLTCERGKWRGCPVTPGVIQICNPIQACDFAELVDGIIGFIFIVAVGLAPLMIIIGAFYILTAGADPKRVETGKNIILYTIIGFAIILLGRALVYVIQYILG